MRIEQNAKENDWSITASERDKKVCIYYKKYIILVSEGSPSLEAPLLLDVPDVEHSRRQSVQRKDGLLLDCPMVGGGSLLLLPNGRGWEAAIYRSAFGGGVRG